MSINNNICSVMQPTFLPWVGYFDLIDQSDRFVFYDDVQFVKQSWHVRNRLKTANGIQYINVPTLKSGFGSNLNKIEIDETKPWRKKLIKTIFYTYQKTSFFEIVYSFFEELLSKDSEGLVGLNSLLIIEISKKIGIETEFCFSSSLSLSEKIRDERLVNICKELNCNSYLSTLGSSAYIEKENPGGAFISNNVKLYYHNYKPAKYTQGFGSFVAYMSILDLLFNVGFNKTLTIVRKGRQENILSENLLK